MGQQVGLRPRVACASLVIAAFLGACAADSPPVVPPLDPAEANRRAAELYGLPATASPDVSPSAGGSVAVAEPGGAEIIAEPVQIVLVWQGISRLHQSFFSDVALTTALSVGLTGEVRSPANLYVRYDAENFRGSIRLQLQPNGLEHAVRRSGDTLMLQDLAPITTALAQYRSGVAATKDFRIESFAIGLESFRGPRGCIFSVAGAPPPDGRLVSPCVEVNGHVLCGEPSPKGAIFSRDAADDIAACLDL
jgi:hypothetical protein